MDAGEHSEAVQAVAERHPLPPSSPGRSDALSRLLFEQCPDAIVIADDEGRFLDVNSAACSLFDYAREQMLRMRVGDLISPSEPGAAEQYALYLATGQATGEFSFVRPDGQVRIASYSAYRLETGKYASILRDITERKAVEERLRESEQHFQAFMNHTPLSAWIVDAEGRFRFVNPGYYKMFGVTDDLTGKTIGEVYPGALTEEYLRNNRTVFEERQVVETTESGIRPDGSPGQFFVVKFPIEMPSGEVLLGGKALDVTEMKQAERALQERVAEIETLLETIPAAVWIATDPECKRIIGNRASYEFVRMPPNSNVSKSAPPEEFAATYRTFINGRELEAPEHPMQRAAAEGREILGIEEKLVFDDGTERDILGNVSPLFDAEGKVRGVIAAFVDITEQKRIEKELRANQEWLTLAFNTARMVIWAWDFVANHVETTPNFSDVYGCPPVTMVEQGIALIHPDDRARHEAIVKEGIRTGKYYSSFRVIRPDNGEIVWVEEQGTVFVDGDGKPQKMLGVAVDVTEREELAQAKQESETQFRRLFEANVLGILLTDLAGTIRQANDAFLDLIGYNRTELESGQISWVDLTPPELLFLDEEGVRQLRERGRMDPYEKAYFHKDGRRVPVLVGGATLDSDKETAIAYVLDLSAQKAHEAEIQALNDRLRRSMTETHHRVKNNLQVISAMIEMHIMEHGDEEMVPIEEYRQLNAHIHTLSIVHDLLSANVKEEEDAERVSVKAVLDRLLPMLQQTAWKKEVRYSVEDAELTSKLCISLALVLNELVTNAFKHGRRQAEVVFRVEGAHAELTVFDDGPGFPEGFSPLEAAHTGLELVESLVRIDLQGRSAYTCRAEGGGCVSITFPLPPLEQ